jgi:hypothetical protein
LNKDDFENAYKGTGVKFDKILIKLNKKYNKKNDFMPN